MAFLDFLLRGVRRKKYEQQKAAAANWPTVSAKLLKATVVPKHELAEGTAAQLDQVEVPYYFSLESGYYGGFVRSIACSDSEGRRLLRELKEDAPVIVRYNPANPDETFTFPADNDDVLPFKIWPM